MKTRTSIREVARVIGLLVSSFSAVDYGKLFYRNLERAKIEALNNFRGNVDAFMHITSEMKLDLFWWIENIYAQVRIIARGNPDISMQTDASMIGWYALLESKETRGRWSITEAKKHINYLEMSSVYFALKSFKDKIKGKHVKVFCDNSTAVAYINNMGGCKSADYNEIAKSI